MRIEKRTIVITGASSGIGKGLKETFSGIGDVVVDISRTGADFKINVSDEKKLKSAFDEIYKNNGEIDMLICCAGYGISGAVELIDEETAKKEFDVNFFGTANACKYAIPKMKKDGKIIVISSATAIFPVPFKAYYSASKAAVDNFARALKMELSQTGIQVTSICPCDIKTKFTENRIKDYKTNERYGNSVQLSTQPTEKTEKRRMKCDVAVKKIYKICEKKHLKPRYIVGTEYKILNLIRRLFSVKIMDNATTKLLYIKENKKDSK